MNGTFILITIAVYFGLLLLVARITARHHTDNDAFFSGNHQSPWYIVSFGMIGASLSGVTFVSVPGMVGSIDMTYMQTCFGFFFGYLIIAHVLLPLYYRLNLTSIYTYLGKRFGNHGVHVGFRYLGGYDIPADEGKNLKPADWTVDANYSIRFLDHFSATAGVSLVHSKVVEEATTVAFNAAAYYRNGFETGVIGSYIVGINVAGLGPKLDYGARYRKAKLPAHYGGGGELGLDFNEQHRLSVSLAAQHYCYPKNADMFTGNVGAEYTFLGLVSVRGGYTYAEHDYSRYSFGAGISFGNIRFNVAHQRGLGDNEVTQTMLSLGLLL